MVKLIKEFSLKINPIAYMLDEVTQYATNLENAGFEIQKITITSEKVRFEVMK